MTYKGSGRDHEHDDGRTPSIPLRVRDILPNHDRGLPLGTKVMTADGILPVEYLEPGDRVITRAGMRRLLGIDTPAPKRFKLTFEREEVIYADGQMVMSETGLPFSA
ncbi:Hint domain-containing protein [Celeribacter sp. PS-C1]|uniref:Hint domain-containing protein n=1 Tax=Celeribacter sp. PS-C1 TaxID=2820813 RepID=UPI001CA5CD9F|nr:Hint domain-containing protein [Celeribacter sp. PS-C1]MBW6417735.1 Hint domain-containing protein [Celeribacter sp. PS-C1]